MAEADEQLLPTQQRKRARWLEWGFFITMELDATTLYVVRRRHSTLKHIYGEARAAVEIAKAYFYRQVGHVDQVLRGDGPFLHGRRIYGSRYSPHDLPDLRAVTLGAPIYDSCRTYLERVTTRDAYSAASKANAHIGLHAVPRSWDRGFKRCAISDVQGARPHCAGNSPCPRRRGDRITGCRCG